MNEQIVKYICAVADKAVYASTYFRIEAGYEWNKGMGEDQSSAFFKEVVSILSGIGFVNWRPRIPKQHGGCPRGFRGAEHLYCHPQDLSGIVKKESINEISAALAEAMTCKLRTIDTFDEFLNFTRDELRQVLLMRKVEIADKILFYYQLGDGKWIIGRPYDANIRPLNLRVPYLHDKDGHALEKIEFEVINEIFDTLVDNGLLETMEKDGKSSFRNARVISAAAVRKGELKRIERTIASTMMKIGDIEIFHQHKGNQIVFTAWKDDDPVNGRSMQIAREDVLFNELKLSASDIRWLAGLVENNTE